MKTTRFLSMGALALALLTAIPAAAAPATTDAKVATGGLRDGLRYDRFIVRFRQDSHERIDTAVATQAFAAALSRNASTGARAATPASATAVRRLAVDGTVFRLSRKLGAADAAALMKTLAADPAVAHVEPDVLLHPVRDMRATDAAPPDDPDYLYAQWNFADPTGGVNLPGLWNLFPTVDGSGVTVAVIDTGITAHDDLDTSLADAGYDFIDDAFVSGRDTDGRVPGGWDLGDWTDAEPWLSECTDGSRPPESSSWHGTNVAGVVAERTNNGLGLAGAAPGAKVLPVRALGHCGGYTSDIADAIVWAAGGHVDGVPENTHPAQVINLSLGGGGSCLSDSVTSDAVAAALGRGATVVVAAGNTSDDASLYTPASCPGVVTVAATGVTGRRAFYSNYGTAVTLAAPGGGVFTNDASSGQQAVPLGFIWAAYNAGTTTPVAVADGGSTYAGMAGTSQATPHVSATVALMLDAAAKAGRPVPTPAQVKTLLTASSRPFPLTPDRSVGSGILDAQGAVAAASGVVLPPQVVPLVQGRLSAPQQRAAGGSSVFAIEVPAGARNLVIRSVGGTGDASLFVKATDVPAADGSDADLRSVHPGNAESVAVARPAAGTWYVRLTAVKDFANVNVLATYVAP
ncbi:serine protease [Luteibacter sp. UNCMF331Sha3.1]|uniref:S8 family serine peptidase n=1 Tax=Luteibacter sp. UNCMF331Sha3.1 TaxID=1502760 RepID=UPI0008B96959|nr:S8 family serine peptidase [Luteibacter sp. UNCMF331Sha3.1]SEN44199.1 serine protease [Luteibacter sp. UNCMF331Sha3.1]